MEVNQALCFQHDAASSQNEKEGKIIGEIFYPGRPPARSARIENPFGSTTFNGGPVISIRNLLVPLDGSRAAEAAIPLATFLGQHLGATITLLHIVEYTPPPKVHGEPHLQTAAQAEDYLEEVASTLTGRGVRIQIHVHSDPETDVAASIVAHRVEQAADLVVMSTHGRGGMRNWVLGSIAQRVVQQGSPVLLVRSDLLGGPPERIQRVRVALDGTVSSEASLPMAAAIAVGCRVPMDLMIVVPTVATLRSEQRSVAAFLPSTVAALLDLEAEAAAEYLQVVGQRLEKEYGLRIALEIRRGDPSTEIIRATHRDLLLAMATHGRYGLASLWAGGVAARVMADTRAPVLLVPGL